MLLGGLPSRLVTVNSGCWQIVCREPIGSRPKAPPVRVGATLGPQKQCWAQPPAQLQVPGESGRLSLGPALLQKRLQVEMAEYHSHCLLLSPSLQWEAQQNRLRLSPFAVPPLGQQMKKAVCLSREEKHLPPLDAGPWSHLRVGGARRNRCPPRRALPACWLSPSSPGPGTRSCCWAQP